MNIACLSSSRELSQIRDFAITTFCRDTGTCEKKAKIKMLEMTYLQDFLLSAYNYTSLWRGIVVGAISLYVLRKATGKAFLSVYR